ncbi:MAG: DUF1501 domain-containing protein [Planctomycetaceae bacterium]|nr:DUF1501 domain-containing protein [Planctomycetaceae bacterium]
MTNTHFEQAALRETTRRHFFSDCRLGLGGIALANMLGQQSLFAERDRTTNPLAPQQAHFPPKVKNVIYLFMAGGPSQFELFNPKPKLAELHGKVIPESFVEGKRFAFLKKDAQLLGPRYKFQQYGESGRTMSELVPHMAEIVDDMAFIKTMKTDVFNHGPAKLFMNTGSPQFGRPSMGAWVTYGIGSQAESLPGFVVLQSGPRGPRGGTPLWGSGFLPTSYQGVPFLNGKNPILNLSSPEGVSPEQQGDFVSAVKDLNSLRLSATNDPEISTRIASYEMAYRMQTSAPEMMDLSGETKETLDMYGVDPNKPSYARNCLYARRLIEKGVRFVQLYHTDWDHHGGGQNLEKNLPEVVKQVDQSSAALIKDLKQRGLLKDTLVIWGGEFGRTPQGEPRESTGRDHHIDAYTLWMAGGGVKPGISIGETDEIGYNAIEDPVHVHDFQATVLHLLGLDHKKLTFRFQGRDFRLTDVHGHVIEKLLS